jgi:hypothetical protein
MAENSAHNNLWFVNIDRDIYRQSQFTDQLRVTRQLTLIVIKQGSEITRVINEPYERKIRAFLDTALSAWSTMLFTEKDNQPAVKTFAINSSKSGSQMRTFPDSSISILDGSLLTQTKLCPKFERQAPDTKPT